MLNFQEEVPTSFDGLVIIDAATGIRASHFNASVQDRRWLFSETGSSLAEEIAMRVREIFARHNGNLDYSAVVIRDGPRTLRISRLEGPEALFALTLEIDRSEANMTRAVSRYQLTRRQSEVLALLLDGSSAGDVARSLVISEYTAQGYVKCLLTKTSSHNRAEMVAKVLDWKPNSRRTTGAAMETGRVGTI